MTDGQVRPRRDWRRVALGLVALGAMSVSIVGQVLTVEVQMGRPLAVVFALTNDAGAVLALNLALSAAPGSSIRKWAWFAIALAAGTGGALNAYHATATSVPGSKTALPPAFGIVVGLEPVFLVLVLSHLIALVTASRTPIASAGGRDGAAVAGDRHPATAGDRHETVIVTTSAARQVDRPTASLPPPDRQQPALDTQALPTVGEHVRPTSTPAARATTPPVRALSAVPAPRPAWMTDALISAAVASMLQARQARQSYGRPRLMDEHGLTKHKALTLQAWIADHDLLRESA